MSLPRRLRPNRPASAIAGLFTMLLLMPGSGTQAQIPVRHANWALADKFSSQALTGVVFSTNMNPTFINKTDSAWYNWRDGNGSRFMLLVPKTRSKTPLFDHIKLAADLSLLHRKSFDANNLPFTTINFTDSTNASVFQLQVDSMLYAYDMRTTELTSKGRAPRGAAGGGRGGRGGGGGGGGGGAQGGGANADFRNFAPDSTVFVFAREHNLYLVDVAKKDTVQLTRDGVRDYSYGVRDTTQAVVEQQQQQEQQEQGEGGGGRGVQQGGNSRDPRVRANVTWSKDSKGFYVQRTDQRGIADLYLIDWLAKPRPKLTQWKYPMPGEVNVRRNELNVFSRASGKIARLTAADKWKDQALSNTQWVGNGSEKLRLIRRDRLRQNLELVEIDVAANTARTLVNESVQGATLEGGSVGNNYSARYINAGGDFLWWSERSGWGHFYLYDNNGKLKNALTAGPWRAESVLEVDSVKRVAWVRGVGREPNENVYQQHLYRVNLDGTALTLLDKGDANHTTTLSPSKRWAIDNFSRPDLVPKAVLRDDRGAIVMDIEETDISRLKEMGWKAPETFIVKAADGVTDIYGNMWKPFDFDPNKKYPIIANVYPGPQTESVSTTFSANNVPQRLAQLGFIVIQIGNRGGSPRRSNAYQAYSFLNLRDYGLADKKSGIEQLAARHSFIDINRVGLFGHSGGGFMTGAAMLTPPYNEFFKVGVSSAGNHDNMVYGDYWAEQNHGLKEVPVVKNTNAIAQNVNGSGAANAASNNQNGGGTVEVAETKWEINVPANHELAANLKGKLLLVHGDMDNNVSPAGTIRLVDALIKANKRFDMMIMPGKAHGFGDAQNYFTRMMFEYFAEHLLGDYYRVGADIH